MAHRTLDRVAEVLRQEPLVQRPTTLANLRLTPSLCLEVDGSEYPTTNDALSDVARVQARLPGVSVRNLWKGWASSRRVDLWASVLSSPEESVRPTGVISWGDLELAPEPVWEEDGEECFDESWVKPWGPWLPLDEGPSPEDWQRATEHKELLATINQRLAGSGRSVLVRWAGERVIAVLSPSFTALDHIAVVEALRARGLNQLAWASVTRRSMSLAVYCPRPALVVGDQRYRTGLHLRNSETGDGRLVVNAYISCESSGGGAIVTDRQYRTFTARMHRGERSLMLAGLVESVDQALAYAERVLTAVHRLGHEVLTPRRWANLRREVELAAGQAGLRRWDALAAATATPAPGGSGSGRTAQAAFSALTALSRRYAGGRRTALEYVTGRFLSRLLERGR